jgi:hypothetical protein
LIHLNLFSKNCATPGFQRNYDPQKLLKVYGRGGSEPLIYYGRDTEKLSAVVEQIVEKSSKILDPTSTIKVVPQKNTDVPTDAIYLYLPF